MSRILPNVFYNRSIKISKFIESTRQRETLISVAPYHCVLEGYKDLLVFRRKFYLFCISSCLLQTSTLKSAWQFKRTHVRTNITTNNFILYIASFYVPKSRSLTTQMKAVLWPGEDNHKLTLSGLASNVSMYLNVLQRVQIRDGFSVIFVWFWTRI
jgi:hypothetical protein